MGLEAAGNWGGVSSNVATCLDERTSALRGWPEPGAPMIKLGVLMLAGGLAYTVGTLFLVNDHRNWFFHATWHLFVIAGSTLHYLAILWYAVPG